MPCLGRWTCCDSQGLGALTLLVPATVVLFWKCLPDPSLVEAVAGAGVFSVLCHFRVCSLVGHFLSRHFKSNDLLHNRGMWLELFHLNAMLHECGWNFFI